MGFLRDIFHPQPQTADLSPAWMADAMQGAPSAPSAPETSDPYASGGSAYAAPTNLLQGISGYGNAPAAAPAPAPRERRSALDTIGRLADVFATVGGATPLYQPTLDARQNRQMALDDHGRQVQMDQLKIASGTMDNTTQAGKITGQALRGVQAILAANPNADVSKVWPALATQAGVDPAHIEAIGNTLASDPTELEGLASTLNDDGKDKYSGNIIYGADADGNLRVYQANMGSGSSRQVKLDDGFNPIDPTKAVNLGDRTALVGSRSGKVATTLENGEKPGGAADRAARIAIAGGNNRTTLTAAQIRANAAGKGKPGDTGDEATNGLALISNIESGFRDLHGMKALAGDNGGAVSNVLSAIGRTGVGQAIGEQAGSPAAQKRLELAKNISLLQQTLIKSLPASATRTKFEQEILKTALPDPSKMSYGTAQTIIGQYRDIFRRAQAQAATSAGGNRALPPRLGVPKAPAARAPVRARAGQPSISNW